MRDTIPFAVLFPVGLAVLALLLLFFPADTRPQWVWYGALVCSLGALGAALRQRAQFRRRLNDLSALLAERVSLSSNRLPEAGHGSSFALDQTALPVRKNDLLGAIEYQLSRLFTAQSQHLQQLQDEKEELEALLHSMAEGIVVIDPQGNIVRCNPAALRLFGLDPTEDWQGRPFQEFSRHPLLSQLLSAASAEGVTQEIEVESQEPRQLAVSVLRLPRSGGYGQSQGSQPAPGGQVLSCHDLTPIKRLESIRADFVANVSHELRTPLTAIKGYAETLLTGALHDPEHATRFLTIIDRHSERLSRLIDDLLTLSNLELGQTELHRKELHIPALVQEAFDVLQEKAQRGQVALSQHIPPALPTVRGDRDRLHQVLINLIDNAVKYTPAQGRVTVTAALYPAIESVESKDPKDSTDWLEIAIADTGCGIPEADIPRLTQRFYRVDKARSRELGGTGLGLAIVKHIVMAHHGALRIESQVNHGTTVRVALPLTLPASEYTTLTS